MPKKLIRALNGEPNPTPPFWFMRQAGRYLPEYRATREQAGSFLKLCFNPELAAEVTMQPIRRYGMSAAILFADILVIPLALGQEVRFENGEGPKLSPLETGKLQFDESKLSSIYETLKLLTGQLPDDVALIGFAGSPWTVATYMVEGDSSKDFQKTKTFAYNNPEEFSLLVEILVDATSCYLISQIEAGAETLQLFDSWAGELAPDEFRKWVIEPTAKIIRNIRAAHPDIKIIGFPRRANLMLQEFVSATGVDAISLDSTVPLEWAFANLNCTIQGNLDPLVLLSGKTAIERETKKILKLSKGKPFIFNLGHGITQFTPPENVQLVCDIINS